MRSSTTCVRSRRGDVHKLPQLVCDRIFDIQRRSTASPISKTSRADTRRLWTRCKGCEGLTNACVSTRKPEMQSITHRHARPTRYRTTPRMCNMGREYPTSALIGQSTATDEQRAGSSLCISGSFISSRIPSVLVRLSDSLRSSASASGG